MECLFIREVCFWNFMVFGDEERFGQVERKKEKTFVEFSLR